MKTKLPWLQVATIQLPVLKNKSDPTFTLDLAGTKIVLSRHFAYKDTDWVLRGGKWFNCTVISTGTVEEALLSAEAYIQSELLKLLDKFND